MRSERYGAITFVISFGFRERKPKVGDRKFINGQKIKNAEDARK